MKSYHNTEVGLRMPYPTDWQEQPHAHTVFLLLAPITTQSQAYRTNASLVMESGFGASFLQVLMKTRMGLRQQLTQFDEIAAEPTNLCGAEGYRIYYKHLVDGFVLEVVYYLLLHEDAIYHLQFTTLQPGGAQWLPLFDEMAQAFEILPEEA